MRSVVLRTRPHHHFEIAEAPDVDRDGVVVAVRAFSLNRGEIVTAFSQGEDGARPGGDFAGVVEAAPEGSGFAAGDRVVGLAMGGAWAERVVTAPFLLCPIPDGVSFEAAVAVEVSGLTAQIALEQARELAGKKVLVTGASGGVGLIAIQLARAAGAQVTALVRDEISAELATKAGASAVAASADEAKALGRYDLIIDLVGGPLLGQAMTWLASRGVCVLAGNAGGAQTTFDADAFRHGDHPGFGGTMLYGLYLGEELTRRMPMDGVAKLLSQVAAGTLDPMIGASAVWTEIDGLARRLLDRGLKGKAVLTLP